MATDTAVDTSADPADAGAPTPSVPPDASAPAAGSAPDQDASPAAVAPFGEVTTVSGEQIDGAQYAGQDLALWFWAPW